MLGASRILDVRALRGHVSNVKNLFLFALIALTSLASAQEALTRVPPRNIVPIEVKQRAQAAAQLIMDQTIRGDFKAALDSMNPEFVKVISRAVGGPEKFKAGLLKMMNEMGQNGVTFQAAITQAPDTAFEVDYGFEDKIVNGKPVKIEGYRQWMVFVPTVKDFQVVDPDAQPASLRKFRKWSFEVAISPKKNESWTFVNGDSITALQLRKLFPFLPKNDQDLKFPPKRVEERKKKK